MTYKQAIQYIHSTSWKGSRPGLERITLLLEKLGNPEKYFQVVHVAGTNGKGSFCAMLEIILRSSGYRTGLFTSPYIEFFEERIQCDGNMISKKELAEVTEYVKGFADEMEDSPTEFELITAIGFEYFRRKNVQIAVVECGMGGRLDSTNVFSGTLLSVITGIALDHTEYLGDTIEKIATEKAGIIRPGGTILYGGDNEEAGAVIKKKAKALGARFAITDRSKISNIKYYPGKTVFDYGRYESVEIPLLGSYQPYNGANVLRAVDLLRCEGIAIPDEAMRPALRAVRWKGRFEKLCEEPLLFFDGGHNPEGIAAAVETVRTYFPLERINLISGVMADKNYEEMVRSLCTVAARVFTVAPSQARSLTAEAYAEVFRQNGVKATAYSNYDEALEAVSHDYTHNFLPTLVVGSLYAYAELKPALNRFLEKKKPNRF